MLWAENAFWWMETLFLTKARKIRLPSGVLTSNFHHKFISENSNMSVFLNEGNQYDMAVDGMKFSTMYNQMHGEGAVSQNMQGSSDAQMQGHKPFDQGSNTQDFGFSFNPGNFKQNQPPQPGPVQQEPFGSTVKYENPEKIFSNGTTFGDFKFDGFGKDAWGIYSSGNDNSQAQQTQDFFSSPFEKSGPQPKQGDFLAHQDEAAGGMWVKDAPVEPQVVEDTSKGKKGFM